MDRLQDGPIVGAFTNLEDVHTRREAIQSILSNLTRNEVREIQHWSLEQDFRHDIVGTLPMELAVQILQEVDLRIAFRSRRVSRKWAMILSSPCVIEALLRQWLSLSDPAPHVPEGVPSSEAFSIMTEQIDAFRTGRPFSELTVFGNSGQDPTSQYNFPAYSTGFLSWYDESSREITILQLSTGISKTWVDQNRERPYSTALSEILLAVSTFSGRVLIYNHLTGNEYCIRLSSGPEERIFLRGGTLAILHGSHVTTWTLATQKTYNFCIDSTNSAQYCSNGIYITPTHQELIYYRMYDDCGTWRNSFRRKTVSFSRRLLNGALQFEDLRFKMPEEPLDISNIPIAVSDNCNFGEKIGALEYGELRNNMTFRMVCGFWPRNSQMSGLCWKDVHYQSVIGLGEKDISGQKTAWHVGLAATDLRAKVIRDGDECLYDCFQNSAPAAVSKIYLWLQGDKTAYSRLLGDETFLVHALNDRLVVYSFDKTLDMSYGTVESTRLRP